MIPRRRRGLAVVFGLLTPLGSAAGQTPSCSPLDSTAAWARASRAWSSEAGLRWSNDSLRRVLLSLSERDQAPRAEFGARIGDTLYARRLTILDSVLAAEMSVILDRFGLPTRSMVGAAGSDAAMLVVQHSWSLQERVLALARALPPGQISPEKLAMLEDRVLEHQGRPQRFGTQFSAGKDGLFRLAPTADLAGLDARRAAAGMPPLAQYVCMFEEAGMRVDRRSLPPAPAPLDSPTQGLGWSVASVLLGKPHGVPSDPSAVLLPALDVAAVMNPAVKSRDARFLFHGREVVCRAREEVRQDCGSRRREGRMARGV